jgi:hypothetical protein
LKLLFLGIVPMPEGIWVMIVVVMRSSHTVQQGMTAKLVRGEIDGCRHWASYAQKMAGMMRLFELWAFANSICLFRLSCT